MKILPIASSSKGNCYYIKTADTALLIDLGVTWKALSGALREHDIDPASIGSVLITHTHTDHIKGLPVSMKRLKAELYMTARSAYQLERDDVTSIVPWKRFPIGPATFVTPFATQHDAAGSVGYLIECPGHRFGLMTDLGTVTPDILDLLAGCDVMVVESNHDIDMLRNGGYPAYLKARVRSDHGHLSNRQCAEAVRFLADHGTRHFFLAHLSEENNTPALAHRESAPIAEQFGAALTVLPPGKDRLYSF